MKLPILRNLLLFLIVGGAGRRARCTKATEEEADASDAEDFPVVCPIIGVELKLTVRIGDGSEQDEMINAQRPCGAKNKVFARSRKVLLLLIHKFKNQMDKMFE